MKGHLTMSGKERRRKSVFNEVQEGRLTLREASEKLGLSYRQCRRSYRRFGEEGDAGLVHRSRGRRSNRRLPQELRDRVVKRYRERYEGFGPTLAAEKLAQEGLVLDHETLRRLLIKEGLWTKRRKRRAHRQRRERRHHFGELLQLDGSHHAWFGQERARACLMDVVDDATGRRLALLAPEETTEAAMRLLWQWIERYGIPQAIYVDKKSVYLALREPTVDEQLAGVEPQTAFGAACAKLGIELIAAHSPQAKGHIERTHGVYQDRFVKELALRAITTLDTANKLLRNGFTEQLNTKFAQEPARAVDFHRPRPRRLDLADVFCFEEFRSVQNDWTVRYKNRHYQIVPENRPLPNPEESQFFQKQVQEERLNRFGVMLEFVIAPLGVVPVHGFRRQFHTVQGTVPGQGLAFLPGILVGPMRAFGVRVPTGRRKQRVQGHGVMVVEILILQAQSHDALADERGRAMLDKNGIAVVGEALGETAANIQAQVHFTKQQRAPVRTDMPPIEGRLNLPATKLLQFHLLLCTLCLHKAASPRVANCACQQWLCDMKRLLSILSVIVPG